MRVGAGWEGVRFTPFGLKRGRSGAYRKYMGSSKWFRKREVWARAQQQPVRCVVCGGVWDVKRDDVHHISYERFGDEGFEDLWAVHRPCHRLLHSLLDVEHPAVYFASPEASNRRVLARVREEVFGGEWGACG